VVLGSFDGNIEIIIKRAQIFLFIFFRNHLGITVFLDALCSEKWKFVQPRL